jgi:RNA recognition motif-containing protein
MAGGSSTKVVQITNIAPQATKDQMQALFGLLGKIEEIRLCKEFLFFKSQKVLIKSFI